MKTICGADCSNCGMQESCAGCVETNGRPLAESASRRCVINQAAKNAFLPANNR